MICKGELEMDIQTLVFGSSCCLASLSGQNPDVSFYESLLSLIYPPTESGLPHGSKSFYHGGTNHLSNRQ